MDNKIIHGDQISLKAIIDLVLFKRIFIVKVTFLAAIIGLIISFIIPEEFESGTSLMPQGENSSSGLSGSLSGLAGLAGINLNSSIGGASISPDLYPNIINSRDFKEKVLALSVPFKENEISLESYLENEIRPNPIIFLLKLPMRARKIFSKEKTVNNRQDNVLYLTKDKEEKYELIDKSISVYIDDETGLLLIKSTFQHPHVSYTVTKFTYEYLKKYISNYSSLNSKNALYEIEKSLEKTESQLNEVSNKLSRFVDGNRNLTNKAQQLELEELQSSYLILSNTKKSLVQEKVMTEMAILKEATVFHVINPIYFPVEKSYPSKFTVLMIFTFLGGFLSIGFLIVRKIIKELGTDGE